MGCFSFKNTPYFSWGVLVFDTGCFGNKNTPPLKVGCFGYQKTPGSELGCFWKVVLGCFWNGVFWHIIHGTLISSNTVLGCTCETSLFPCKHTCDRDKHLVFYYSYLLHFNPLCEVNDLTCRKVGYVNVHVCKFYLELWNMWWPVKLFDWMLC